MAANLVQWRLKAKNWKGHHFRTVTLIYYVVMYGSEQDTSKFYEEKGKIATRLCWLRKRWAIQSDSTAHGGFHCLIFTAQMKFLWSHFFPANAIHSKWILRFRSCFSCLIILVARLNCYVCFEIHFAPITGYASDLSILTGRSTMYNFKNPTV